MADRADAGDHLSFQLGEAARESLREFRAELRAGALDTPFRAGDAPKRKPESSRRRKITWQRFSKRVKSKYDPRESEQNHPYAHVSLLGSDSNPFGGPTLPWLVSSPAKFNPTDADRNHPFAQATCLPEDAPTSLDWERGFHWGVLCALSTGLLVWALTWTCRRTCCRSKEAATSLEQPPRHLAGTATFATPKSPPALPPWVAPGPRQPIPSPPLPVETVLVTATRGKAYHRRGCIHVRGHETRTFRPCLVCQPHVLLQEEDTRARLQALNHDDAQRDTNHAIAHLAWWLIVLLVMGTSLGCFAFSSWVRPWRASRPARDPTYLKVGSLEKRVRFSLSPDSGSEAEREKAVVPESAAAQASLTTRHHRKRGRHPLVASQGSSLSAAKRAHPDNGPQAGVLPANAWARESLRLVRDHLSPTTQRLYDSHWRWWELFTRRRGVSALRTVDRFDPGEEELFLDYLVYLFVGQGLAAATAQARLGAIRSVHLQLGFPDPLKPLPRLLLALEGIRRRRGPVTKRRPVTPRMLARANSALPSDLWGRGLSCALQLGFFFLLRVSEIVGGTNPRLGLRAKDVALFHKGRQVHHPYFDQADEVQVVVRASKTDPEGETATRNLYRSGAEVCPVLSTARYLSLLWQQSGEPSPTAKFFPHLTRQDLQEVLQTIAASLGEEPQSYTPHSLRFGGASAMWAGGFDSYVLRTWGRWNSDAFLAYLWTSRKASANTAARMAAADMTPVRGFPSA